MTRFMIGVLLSAGTCWPNAALAQAVTLADLEPNVIEASVTEMRTVRIETGKEGQQRAQHNLRVTIAPSGGIQYSQTITIHRIQKGDTDTRSHSAKAVIGQPHKFRDGQAVWVYENGGLNLLRVQEQGGTLWKLTFSRQGGGLSCTVSKAFAREDGVGALATKSTNFGVQRVEFLSTKVVGSSCRVSKS